MNKMNNNAGEDNLVFASRAMREPAPSEFIPKHRTKDKMKDADRPFRLGKGNALMWIVGAVGFAGSLLAFVLSFIPPGQIQTGSSTVWYSVLIVGCIIMVIIPFIIYAMRKPSWKDPNAEFAPFHWEEKK